MQAPPSPGFSGQPPQQQGPAPLSPEVRQQMLRLEEMAEVMYTTQDEQKRQFARQTLRAFEVSAQCIPQCQTILDHSQSQWALILASSSLKKLVEAFFNKFTGEQTLEIRNYLLTYLGLHCGRVPPVVAQNLIDLVAVITKSGWLSEPRHQDVHKEISKFLKLSVSHCILGLNLMQALVDCMNTRQPGMTSARHRKIACSFRDKVLLFLFQVALSHLTQIRQKQVQVSDARDAEAIQRRSLELLRGCLKFDYIGTNPDETSADFGTIQVPASWRPIFESPATMELLFGLLPDLSGEAAAVCMEAIVEFGSVRRSIFSRTEARTAFVTGLCQYTRQVLQLHETMQLLSRDENLYHHFCRLLDRMKSNYTLKELVNMNGYHEWIQLVAKFTIHSFQNWFDNSNSLHYLVGLWARITLALPYMKGETPQFLFEFLPQVTQALISTRVDAAAEFVEQGRIDELFSDAELSDQLKHLPSLTRFRYDVIAQYISQRMNPLLQQYQQAVQALSNDALQNQNALRTIEVQLAAWTFCVAAIVGGHPNHYSYMSATNSNQEQNEQYDAELCGIFFRLMPILEFRASHPSHQRVPLCKHLDLAVLSFFENFRRAYVTMDANPRSSSYSGARPKLKGKSSSSMEDGTGGGGGGVGGDDESKSEPDVSSEPRNIFERISRVLQSQLTQEAIFSGIIKKIVHNLQVYVNTSDVLEHSLNLLNNLTIGYASSRIMAKLETARQMLTANTVETFQFMRVAGNEELRTDLFRILTRLVFEDHNIELFDQFVKPLEQAGAFIAQHQNPRAPDVKRAAIGLCSDVLGVLQGTRNSKSYTMFFDWFHPKFLAIVLRLIETWWDDHELVVACLGVVAEFVHNTNSRINFDRSSVNGIILFREASKALTTYAFKILNSNTPPQDVYEERIRGLTLCMQMMTNCFMGEYVNFGVFTFYKDKALENAITHVVRLLLSVDNEELMAYKEPTATYFAFLEALFDDHCAMLLGEERAFLALFSSVVDNVDNFDKKIVIKCCSTLDHIFTFRWKQSVKRNDEQSSVQRFDQLMEAAGALPSIAFNTVMTEFLFGTENLWFLTRPLFSMLLARRQLLNDYAQVLAAAQSPEHQQRLPQLFAGIMQDVKPRLDMVNRDKFTESCHAFRQAILQFCVRPSTI